MQLSPPPLFATVEEGLYRGGYAVIRNFNFLLRLKLKTVVSIVPEVPTSDLADFCRSHDIVLKHIVAEKFKGDPQLLPTDINAVLALALNRDLHPMYIHCLDGRHVAGMVMMTLRKAQGWGTAAIEAEYQRFNGECMSEDERGFLSDFAGGFMMPERIPNWMWGGSWTENGRTKKHPQLKIKFPQNAAAKALANGGDAAGTTGGSASMRGDGLKDGGTSGFGLTLLKESETLNLDDIALVRTLDDRKGTSERPSEVVVVVPGMEAHALSVKSSLVGGVRFKTKERTGRAAERHHHPSKRTNSL